MRQFVYQGAQPRVLEQDAYHFVEKLDSGQFEGGGHMQRERKRERLREKRENTCGHCEVQLGGLSSEVTRKRVLLLEESGSVCVSLAIPHL